MVVGVRRFVKRTDSILGLDMGHFVEKENTTILTERGLVGNFLGLWPTLKIVLEWVTKNWSEQSPSTFYCGKGFFVFIFETIED